MPRLAASSAAAPRRSGLAPGDAIERTLRARIEARRARIGVIGLGYVGLPLACTFAEGGFPVVGVDCDPAKVEALAAGRSYIHHLPAARIRSVGAPLDDVLAPEPPAGRFAATTDLGHLAACDAIVICVPTPLTPSREPDLSYVEASARAVAETLRPGQLVVLESTTYPGTTEEILQPLLEANGLVAYKRDIDDTRESPALFLIDLLQRHGARASYHDPYVPALGRFRKYDFDLRSVPLGTRALRASDATLVVTDHSCFDPDFIVRHSRLVVDTRNLTRDVRTGRERIIRA